MASSIFTAKFLDFQTKSLDFWTLFRSFSIAICIAVIFFVVRYVLWRRKYHNILPGKRVRVVDILGNLADLPFSKKSRNGFTFNVFLLQLLSGYSELFSKHKLFCFWISYNPFVILVKSEAVEALISGTKMMQKSWSYNMLHPWLGTGLLTSHGAKWKSRRKLLTPSFHFEILKDFLPIFNEQSQILIKCLQKETNKDSTDIVMPITLCSLDIICETTLGVSIKAQENSDSQYVKSVSRVADIIMERVANCLYWPDIIFYSTENGRQFKEHLKLLHNFTRSVIQEKKNKLLCGEREKDTGKRKRKALMDVLLEHHIETKNLSEEDIREEVDTFAFEGHDTTSMGMSWALYLIGLHKDCQAMVHEELDRIFGDDVERPAETDDLNDMKYLDRVLKESQRIYPSVPFFGRQAQEDVEICGYTIPKGASVSVWTYCLHRDKDVFPNPEKFDPDRFLPENSLNRHPYAYIPFSAGPRNCIGQRFAVMEEKVVISTLLRNYTVESLDQRDKLPPVPELILRAPCPIRIRIRPRKLKN